MARHRHAVSVRADGLPTVLGPLARDPAVLGALLVDVDSGMVLDGWAPGRSPGVAAGAELEELGAAHAELVRLACAGPPGAVDVTDVEVTVARGRDQHVVVRGVADPFGGRLALSVLVSGPARAVRRVRRRLDEVSTAALTAGPTVSLRPRDGAWTPGAVEQQAEVPRPRPAARPAPAGVPEGGGPALTVLPARYPVSGAALFTPVTAPAAGRSALRDAVAALPETRAPYAGRPAVPSALPPAVPGG